MLKRQLAPLVQIHFVTPEFFFFKIQETCTLTTFVEQKPSLCVKKLGNFMRVYVNRERAVWGMETIFAWGESSVTCNRRILLMSKEKIPWPFKRPSLHLLKKVFWRALKLSFKTEFARGPGRGDTCHLSDLDETLPDWRYYQTTLNDKVGRLCDFSLES